ncbi:nuclear transport factor 2 family protein [Niveibacterium sp. SC-1]|uniref:nuclear transport factor 2 family protein n=1 Tax=Niveibacterium sp. SC-1 TaxID=3135646 RepID=UPI00311F0199
MSTLGAIGATDYDAIVAVLQDYLDGLYHSDTTLLRKAMHPRAIYACATSGELVVLSMDEYFPIVDRRPSPASHGHARQDRLLSIEFAGPVTALVRLECAIPPKRFMDFLTLLHVEGRWQIMSKVFHYHLMEESAASTDRVKAP